jgi:hypothetical protein
LKKTCYDEELYKILTPHQGYPVKPEKPPKKYVKIKKEIKDEDDEEEYHPGNDEIKTKIKHIKEEDD